LLISSDVSHLILLLLDRMRIFCFYLKDIVIVILINNLFYLISFDIIKILFKEYQYFELENFFLQKGDIYINIQFANHYSCS